jgi:hypothetical protein
LSKRKSLTNQGRVSRAFALTLKRSGVAPEAALLAAFEGLLDFDEVLGCELLAKHEEHVRGDVGAALLWAERGFRLAAPGLQREAFARRRERLQGRTSRSS